MRPIMQKKRCLHWLLLRETCEAGLQLLREICEAGLQLLKEICEAGVVLKENQRSRDAYYCRISWRYCTRGEPKRGTAHYGPYSGCYFF